ncbi:MAG: hypothetical protein AB7F67_07860 [Rhodospirillaceae bacterium]
MAMIGIPGAASFRATAILCALCAFGMGAASAAPITYNSESTFLTAATTASIGLTLDSLDFAADGGSNLLSVARTGYTIDDNDSPGSLSEQNFSTACAGGAQPTTGCVVVTIGANGVTFNFASAINAFGLLVNKSVLATGLTSLTLNGLSISGVFNPNPPSSTDALIGFFGLIDTMSSFSTVTLAGIPAGPLLGLDDVRFGALESTAVSEPAALVAIFGLALAGLAAAARRRHLSPGEPLPA